MSHAGATLGLSDLQVEQVHRDRGIEIYAKPTERACCIHCQHRPLKIKATHERTLKHTRQGNQVMTLHLKVAKYHCPRCGRNFRHRFPGVKPRFRASEAFRLEVFEAHDGGVTQRKLTRTHAISAATAERWYQSYCLQRR